MFMCPIYEVAESYVCETANELREIRLCCASDLCVRFAQTYELMDPYCAMFMEQ